MLSKSTLLRLETQIEILPMLVSGATPEALRSRTVSGKWSAHENLAHLARHHAVLLERLTLILSENAPKLNRYRAEDDLQWPDWSRLPTEEVISRLRSLRLELIRLIKGLSETEASRIGIHPLFGEMDIARWLEFFLLHEAHHLYLVMVRLGEVKRNRHALPVR
jgi:hypothetical protein